MKIHVSLSMPMVSESTYKPVWAKTIGSNAEYLKSLLSNPTLTQVATTVKGTKHPIFRVTLNPHEDFYFVHDVFNDIDTIQYGVRVKTFDIKGLAEFKTLGQVSVWRNPKYLYLHSGFAAWVFKQVLFPFYGNIVSDSSQSSKGKAFWFMRITDELELGTFIYALGVDHVKANTYNLEEVHEITRLRETEKYYSTAPDTRGDFYRILLSKKRLTVT